MAYKDNTPELLALVILMLILILAIPARSSALEVSFQNHEGAMVEKEQVPLIFHQVDAEVFNQVAAVQQWFHFKNNSDQVVELTTSMLLVPGELVDGFSYYNGEERIVGEVLEKQAAAEVYQELTGLQRDPGILEQDGERFRFQVYPVAVGETKPVDLRSIMPLELKEGRVALRIPRENLPTGQGVFSLKINIADDLPILDVSVPGIPAVITRKGPNQVRVSFETDQPDFKQDLVISYTLDSQDNNIRFSSHAVPGEEGTFMLLVSPKDKAGKQEVIGRDIVFVVDISGSMEGQPLAQTKQAMIHIIGKLHPEDRFNIIAFDDEPAPFWSGMAEVTDAQRAKAVEGIKALATRGGTNIRGALEQAYKELPRDKKGRSSAIVFLTDGVGDNPPAVVLADVRKKNSNARIFSFGAGNGVNRAFLDRLARENRGISTFIQRDEEIKNEMTRLYDRISMPVMVDLSLDIQGPGIQVLSMYPKQLPDLYQDNQVVILGRYKGEGKGTITIRGRLKGRDQTIRKEVYFRAKEDRHVYLEKLWAGKRIAELEDMLMDRGDSEELVQEITRLGIVYNLVTDYTTFLAVPESLKTEEIKEKIRKGTRGYDKKLVDSIDGIKLSMQEIPPGDPVLSVIAPEDARQVVAYFPFGLIKRMSWDPIRGCWSARFLVPRDVEDGNYEIRVNIVHKDGHREWRTISYRIDATAPEFEAWVPAEAMPGQALELVVDPFEPVAKVTVILEDGTTRALKLDLEDGMYKGVVETPDPWIGESMQLKILVQDRAGNRFEQDYEVLNLGR